MFKAFPDTLTHYPSYPSLFAGHSSQPAQANTTLLNSRSKQFAKYIKKLINLGIAALYQHRKNRFNETYAMVDYAIFKELLCDGAVGQIRNTDSTTQLLDRRLQPYALIKRPSISSDGTPISTRYFIARKYL